MKNYLLIVAALIFTSTSVFGQTVLEDFEDGGKLGWNVEIGDGTFSVVDNPAVADTTLDPLNINRSAKTGSYVKEEGKPFSLLISFLDQPMDLSVNNKFRIQINSPIQTDFLFKLEGAGEQLEKRKTIAVTNRWVEYEFDMSAAAGFTTITKIILFFDPGNGPSSDTYLFDNIIVEAADACAGTVPTAGIVDDFECQRNIAVGNPGYLDLEAVSNPDPSGINTSSGVGQYTDPAGSGQFHALVYNYGAAGIPLVEKTIIKIKVWAPVAGRLLFKLEGGTSPARERDAQITVLNQWMEYSIDFSDLAGSNYTRLVFFFNAGVSPTQHDIYYIDDIVWEAPPSGSILEDFEDGGKLSWGPLNDDAALHGSFNIIANPDTEGNSSASIGSYTKGSSQFSTVSGILVNGLDLSEFGQINMQVWAPEGAQTATMQLVSALQGNKSKTRDITETGKWIELNFNFEEFNTITDFESLNILFDEGTASNLTYLFDNLSVGKGTVDPCEAVETDPAFIDDFDCQRNIGITTGADRVKVINNPDPTGINADPLDKVAEYTDPDDEWSAVVWDFGRPIDLSFRNQLVINVWSPSVVPMLFKLEGGTTNAVEVFTDVTTASSWVQYIIDFSAAAGTDHTRLAVFMNAGQKPGSEVKYYLDDLKWQPAPLTACVADFESRDLSLATWTYFPDNNDNPGFAIVENPDKSDVNPSDTVGIFVEKGNGAQPWAGMFTDLEAPISLPNDNKTIKMKVWADHAATMVMKLERGRDGAPATGDTPAEYTNAGQWQELTWDFTKSPNPVPDNALYDRITLILDIGNIPTEDKNYYFDDIAIASSNCNTSTGLFNPVVVERLKIAPNPVSEMLTVSGAEGLQRFEVVNMLGQKLFTIQTTGQSALEMDFSSLEKGVYLLVGYDKRGVLKANAKFVKQ